MAKTTKTKVKDSLKNLLIKELTDSKEQARLVRVKENSNLREIIAYTSKQGQMGKICQEYINFLDKEGIKVIQKDTIENNEEWSKVTATTNFQSFPTFFVNGEYLVYQRDFNNPRQCLNALKYLGNPKFDNPPQSDKLLEYLKTSNYQLHTRLGQLEQKLQPLQNFITNLQKELQEEENIEISTEAPKTGGCGSNK